MARKRKFSTFNLSFLDIMSCGFGAVILIFLIIKHDTETNIEDINKNVQSEIRLLEDEIKTGKKNLAKAKNTLSDLDQTLKTARGRSKEIRRNIEFTQGQINLTIKNSSGDKLENIKKEIIQLENKKQRILSENEELGDNILRTIGQGDRQYLTGMKLGGSRILILVDRSASMLDERIVNIIRRRNMKKNEKIASIKWQRALSTTNWISAQLPENSLYQIYSFNTKATPTIPGTEGRWLELSDGEELDQALINLREQPPEKGTSLINVFQRISEFTDPPDNIFLITDGLPTQGEKKPNKNTIDSIDRVKLFNTAKDVIPPNIPINIVLLPMEGDPMAASAFWKLAQVSKGSFMSPSKDWP